MGRNTALLAEVIHALSTELDEPEYALDHLASHFHDVLLMNVGDVNTVKEYAKQLRLHITEDERSVVLDHIAEKQMVMVTNDPMEAAINSISAGIGSWSLDRGERGWLHASPSF